MDRVIWEFKGDLSLLHPLPNPTSKKEIIKILSNVKNTGVGDTCLFRDICYPKKKYCFPYSLAKLFCSKKSSLLNYVATVAILNCPGSHPGSFFFITIL